MTQSRLVFVFHLIGWGIDTNFSHESQLQKVIKESRIDFHTPLKIDSHTVYFPFFVVELTISTRDGPPEKEFPSALPVNTKGSSDPGPAQPGT